MEVFFSQIYIEPGITFPFSHHFQRDIASKVNSVIDVPASLLSKYDIDWSIMFRISAKRVLTCIEVQGPTVYKKEKDIEYSLFLPFIIINESKQSLTTAVEMILREISNILSGLGFETANLNRNIPAFVSELLLSPKNIMAN